MTPARAQEIWQNRSPFGEVDITPEEKSYVKSIWQCLVCGYCWMVALHWIANGQAGPDALIGSAVFTCQEGWVIEQTPVFRGESIDSPSVIDRARRHLHEIGQDLVCNERLVLFETSTAKFYPPSNH